MEKTARTYESMVAGNQDAPALPQQAPAPSSPHILRLTWKLDAPGSPAAAFAASIASYLFDACQEVVVESREHELLDDLDLDELLASIRSGRIGTVAFRTGRIDLAGEWQIELAASAHGSGERCSLALTVCEHEQPWTQVDWLQARFDHPAPMPALAIPRGPAGVSVSVFHGLVVLAARFGQVDLAELARVETSAGVLTVARWHFEDPPEGAIPVIAHEGETLWLATTTPPTAATKPACWVEIVDSDPTRDHKVPVTPDQTWQERFSALLTATPLNGSELAAHLQELAPVLVPFRVDPLCVTPPLAAMAPPQDGVVCMLVPTASEVCIGIDFDQDDHIVRQALLHAYAHILLGHVRPGDTYGHWDTVESLGTARPHRRWDKEVREHLAPWCRPLKETHPLSSQPVFKKGDLVQRVNRPELIGIVREPRWDGQMESWNYLIQFGAQLLALPEEVLQPVQEIQSPWDSLSQGSLSGLRHFICTLTFHRLHTPTTRVAFAFSTARTQFYPHQFKPLLKFLR